MSRYTTTPAAKHRAQWAAEQRSSSHIADLEARLNAALHERHALLTMLREIEPWFDTWITEIGPAEDALIERVRAAIAKAEGQS